MMGRRATDRMMCGPAGAPGSRAMGRDLLLNRNQRFLQCALLRLNIGDLLFQRVQISSAGAANKAGQAAQDGRCRQNCPREQADFYK